MKKANNNPGQSGLFENAAIPAIIKEKDKRDADYVFNIVDAITSPILTFSQSWAESIPKRLLEIIPIARMQALMTNTTTATDEECVVYLFTRTMEAPMDREWVDIYLHVSCGIIQRWFSEDHWDDVQAPRSLSEWLKGKLRGLSNHIYKKRREILKSRLKSEQKVEKEEKPRIKSQSPHSTAEIQQASFDF